jgi:hypothetical protein
MRLGKHEHSLALCGNLRKRLLISTLVLVAFESNAWCQLPDRLLGNTWKITWTSGVSSYVCFSTNGKVYFGSGGSSYGYALSRGKPECSDFSAVKGYKDHVCGTCEISGQHLSFKYSGTNSSRYGVIPVNGSYSFVISGDSCSGSASGSQTGTVGTCKLVQGRGF